MFKSTMLQASPALREQVQEEIREAAREAQEDAREAQQEARAAAEEAARGRTAVIHVPPPYQGNEIPPQAETISIAFFITVAAVIIGWPIMRAFAKRIERGTPAPAIPQEVRDQLHQLSQSVDAIAIEVERISEGQRYTTKLLSEQPRQPSRLDAGQA